MTYPIRSAPRRGAARWAAGATMLATSALLLACGGSDVATPTNPERIPVAAVRLDPLDETLLVGTERTLQATPLSSTGAVLADRVIAWRSDNTDVALVSAAGLLTARAAGTAGISATSEGKSSRIEVHIVAPNPVPVLATITPATVDAGTEGPVMVDVTGGGFTDATRLRLNDVEQPTTRLDAATLRLTLTTAAMAQATTLTVTAVTPAPGGGVSNALELKITDVGVPTITALEPRQITAGWDGAFTLSVSGTRFTPRSIVWWDGAPRATRYVDATALQVTIDPQDVRMARVVQVVVETPAPGGGQAKASFTVNAVPVARVTVQSPWGHAWTWRQHRLPLTALAEDQLGRELPDRRATWELSDPSVVQLVPLSEREVAIYGRTVGETEVAAVVDGVRAQRAVPVHEVPNFDLVYETGEGDDRHLMLWELSLGTAPHRLATPMVAFAPSPSPDGREIAFAGVNKGEGVGGNVDLAIVGRDGGTRRVAPSPAFEGDPAWSPDGRRLAFASDRANGVLDVFVVELATGAVTRLTDANPLGGAPGSGTAARAPAWSPDGTQIAYTVRAPTGAQLWVMAADGSNKRQLTNSADANDLEPAWSPDGSMIAFARVFRQPQGSLLMGVTPDGRTLGNLGGRVVRIAATPAWSPDGVWLTTSESRGSGAGAIHAFSFDANAGPRVVLPEVLGGGRHARWVRRP